MLAQYISAPSFKKLEKVFQVLKILICAENLSKSFTDLICFGNNSFKSVFPKSLAIIIEHLVFSTPKGQMSRTNTQPTYGANILTRKTNIVNM